MKVGILVALAILVLGGALLVVNKSSTPVSVNKVTTMSPSEQKEVAFQESQATSADTSVGSIEDDLNNTVIQDEDFSELE